MSYILIHPGENPIFVNWYDVDEFKEGTIVINIRTYSYSKDGVTWHSIKMTKL